MDRSFPVSYYLNTSAMIFLIMTSLKTTCSEAYTEENSETIGVFNITRYASCFLKQLYQFMLHCSTSFGIINSVSRVLAVGILCGLGEAIFLQLLELLLIPRIFLAWIHIFMLIFRFQASVPQRWCEFKHRSCGQVSSKNSQRSCFFSFQIQSTDQVKRGSL